MFPTLPSVGDEDGGVSGGTTAAPPVSAVRQFNDDESQLRVPVVAASNVGDTFSVITLVRPEAKTYYESVLAGWTSAQVLKWSFGTNGAGVDHQPFFYSDPTLVTPSSGGLLTAGSSWWLYAYCQESGAGTGFFRTCELGGSPAHVAATGAVVMSSVAGGHLTFGRTDSLDDLDALLATVALGGVFLSEAQFDAIAAGAATALLLARSLGGVWDMNQADAADAIPDLAGNHVPMSGTITGASDQNGISGTAVDTVNVPAWAFGA